ncbi:RNA-directed DNA polymerase, eukaryota, reverse transcriptase zinc-binding domain protein [Tanacetum coccineum]|uniref:RNA-directed DNA polymerase, eukaryota, reverse transcriptase zinc-binding domain protein n=1 Tax=Tanacetum coccineum TaxID=301880 RepID=A0ABQ5F6M0_9ASTR
MNIGLGNINLNILKKPRNVHNTLHVLILKKCLSDESLLIPMKELRRDVKLNFVEEPVEIIDREVKKLKQNRIPIVKVRWNSKRGPEFTWEHFPVKVTEHLMAWSGTDLKMAKLSIHGIDGGLHDIPSIKSKSGLWFRITRIKDDLLKVNINLPSIFKKRIGNGCDTLFWHDNWLGGSNLKATFPRLFRLETKPSCLVRDQTPSYIPLNTIIAPSTAFASTTTHVAPLNRNLVFKWAWNRPIRSEEELNELSGLCNLVTHLRLTLHEDQWECTVMDSRVFTVKGLRTHIIAMSNNTLSNPTRWNKILPLKINIFSWRTSNTRLPTRLNLDIRGVDLHTIRCPICDDALESEERIFVYCELAKETWRGVVDWWKLSNVNFSNLQDVISLAERPLLQQRAKCFLTPLCNLPFGIYGGSATKWSSIQSGPTST